MKRFEYLSFKGVFNLKKKIPASSLLDIWDI
jgi:hypothetical protein